MSTPSAGALNELLADAGRAFERLARDPVALAAYRSQTCDLDGGFGARTPDW